MLTQIELKSVYKRLVKSVAIKSQNVGGIKIENTKNNVAETTIIRTENIYGLFMSAVGCVGSMG
jgi:mannose/fructose/N-acetylgalactosamine-specific phosphotransferase system component IIB